MRIFIQNFVTQDDVNYYKSMSNDEIKKEILYIDTNLDDISDNNIKDFIQNTDFRRICGLPEGDIDFLLEQFREENFTKYCRKGDWQLSITDVPNNDGIINAYETWTASFRYLNKWNQESELIEYKIITDNNKKILWLGIDEGYHFISENNNIYGFNYKQNNIILFPNICTDDDIFYDDITDNNDKLILKYKENITMETDVAFNDAKNILRKRKIGVHIPINEYFKKWFFYKEIKWKDSSEYMYSYNRNTTILISIKLKDNLFYIEIKNITYSLYGYILLDLNEIRIVEAKEIGKISFIDKIKASYINWINNNYIYINREIYILTFDDADTLLTAIHGSIINKIKMEIKYIILKIRISFNYKLVIIRNKFVYIFGLDGFKKELREESRYSYYFNNYITMEENYGK